MIKIIADQNIPFLKGALEPFADVYYYSGDEINQAILRDADALITRTRTLCNKTLLEGTNIRFIATATIGFDHIDTDYCHARNIQWSNAPGCNSGSVMQYMSSALVRLALKYNFKFSNKTLGIIGNGNVGSKVAQMATALGFKVLINDPPLQRAGKLNKHVSLEELKEKADIITLHVPLIKEGIDKTLHLVDQIFLKSVKSSAIIINTSRGNILNNKHLKEAIKSKQIRGAVLDVWENEPHLDSELLNLVDYATPHIAGYSVDGKANGTAMSVQAVSDFFGFGLKNWFPKNVPKPDHSLLKIDRNEKTEEEFFSELILATYDILEDDTRLRNSVATFEKQRGDYPIRCEFANYSVQVNPKWKKLEKQIHQLGFKTQYNAK